MLYCASAASSRVRRRHPITIEWTQTKDRYEYYYGSTGTCFSAQIGVGTNAGKYVWMIFHDDFRYCVFGGEADRLDEAKRQSVEWLVTNVKLKTANA
jgi:hypothetical protein